MGLEGKVAIVTGAGSGIGKATALRIALDGAHVGVLDIQAQRAEAVAAAIRSQGGRATPLCADVSDELSMRRAVDGFAAATNRLDVIVANAGVNGTWAPIDRLKPSEWDQTVSVNLRGTYLTLHTGVPHLKRAGAGAIVIVSSMNGTRVFSTPGATAYSASKAALVAMAKMLALELAKHRIRVNAVCPGSISTGIPVHSRDKDEAGEPVSFPHGSVPLTRGRPGRPEDVADLICFLVSDQAKHITGTPVWIDGAESLLMG